MKVRAFFKKTRKLDKSKYLRILCGRFWKLSVGSGILSD